MLLNVVIDLLHLSHRFLAFEEKSGTKGLAGNTMLRNKIDGQRDFTYVDQCKIVTLNDIQ